MLKIKSVIKRKKFWVILGISIILLAALIFFFLWQNKEQPHNNIKEEEILKEDYLTISFDTDGGSTIDSIVIKTGDTISKPDTPKKEGYTFKGWYIGEEEFDFSKPITEEITLKAKWEIAEETDETSANNSNSNKPSNNSSNNGSTTNNNNLTKINLNNNISITEYHINSGNIDCFYYMFVTNLQEVFPTAIITRNSNKPDEVDFWHTKQDRQAYEVSTEEIDEYLASKTLRVDTAKEGSFKNILEKYKKGSYKGIANVTYTEENHRFTFSYDYISFNGLNVSANGEQANKEIQNILASSTKFNGPCGGFDNYENKTLTEELCSKYNLDCDRW